VTTASAPLLLDGVEIVDTFAEAFPITGTRLIITASTRKWAWTAATVMTGNATSVIACDCEAGIERFLPESETPDGRPGVSVLAFAFSRDALAKALVHRVGQSVLTCPTTACFNGIEGCAPDRQISVGGQLRFFGDTWQSSKKLGDRRFWRVPVMDGEFVCEEKLGTVKGVAGGNLLLLAADQAAGLAAAEWATRAIRRVPDCVLPFPGGVVRSGSKVGSKYKTLKASTNEAYCPTLRGVVNSELPPEITSVYEIVIDGLTESAVAAAMRAGLHAACRHPGLLRVTAGNYGGKLGPFHFSLRDLLA
jgi:formylmethanofuran--tetrahydromethanopterin N-formyltransferase